MSRPRPGGRGGERLALIAAVAAVALCGCGSNEAASRDGASTSAAMTPALRDLVEAAEAEGELNLNWVMSSPDTVPALIASFRDAYDLELEINHTPSPGFPANLAKLVEERRADRPAGTDAYVGSQDYLLAGGPEGQDIFEPVDWGAFSPDAERLAATDGIGVSLLDQIPGFAFNTDEISEDELPHTMEDVLQLREPVASTTYAAIFNFLGADELMGRDAVTEYLSRFRPVGLVSCLELDRVASGEFAGLWMSCGNNMVDIAKQKGAPLDSVVIEDAATVHTWYMAVLRHAVNPHAAKLWVSWLATPEAQAIVYEHELADNRLIPGSHTAKQIAALEADDVELTLVDYDFVRRNPGVSDPDFIAELQEQLPGELMLRQVRVNRWRDDVPQERIEEAVRALAELPSRIPEVRGWYQGQTRAGEDDFDFVLIVDFDDEAAFERYLSHPAHVDVVTRLVSPVLASTARIRCELAA